MNVERLHAIVRALLEDLRATGLPGILNNLAAALENLAGQPGAAQLQEQVSSLRSDAAAAVDASKIDDWPASWKATLEELGLASLFGTPLGDRIEQVFVDNEITPQTAGVSIREIAKDLSDNQQRLIELANGFEAFNLE